MELNFELILQLYKEKVAQLEHELIMQMVINQQLKNELQKENKKGD